MTMNQNVPFIWRVNYRSEAASPETFLEIAHEKRANICRKTFPAYRSIRRYRRTLTAAFRGRPNRVRRFSLSGQNLPVIAISKAGPPGRSRQRTLHFPEPPPGPRTARR